jgi:hypothetical protein
MNFMILNFCLSSTYARLSAGNRKLSLVAGAYEVYTKNKLSDPTKLSFLLPAFPGGWPKDKSSNSRKLGGLGINGTFTSTDFGFDFATLVSTVQKFTALL